MSEEWIQPLLDIAETLNTLRKENMDRHAELVALVGSCIDKHEDDYHSAFGLGKSNGKILVMGLLIISLVFAVIVGTRISDPDAMVKHVVTKTIGAVND